MERLRAQLEGWGLLDAAAAEEIRAKVLDAIDEAVAFAEGSPWPEPEDALLDVYSDLVEPWW